jgi:hypothetical protein
MDILKYLDVLIGLALVMVLLSPMVTAVTQIYMWLRNRRTRFLQEMLQRLLMQVVGPYAVGLEARTAAAGTPAARITLTTAGGTVLGTTGANGDLFLPGGLPEHEVTSGPLAIVATDAAGQPVAGLKLTARYVPQGSLQPTLVTTGPSSATGTIAFEHTYTAAPALASRVVHLTVTPPSRTAPAATVVCSVNGSAAATVDLTAPAPHVLELPRGTQVPFKYDFALEVKDAGGAAIAGATVVLDFPRFEGADRPPVSGATDSSGAVAIATLRALDEAFITRVVTAIVQHPVLARASPAIPGLLQKIPPFKNRTAEVVEREELIRVLLELGAGEGAVAKVLRPEDEVQLRSLLALNGIPDPAVTLSNVRTIAQQLENDAPDTAAHVRHAQAIVRGAQSDLVGKINHWFDAAAARATQQYAAEARFVTVGAAFLVAVAIQLDTFGLLRRLASDPELRSSLLAEAQAEQERIDKQPGSPDNADDLAVALARREEIQRNLATLRSPSFSILPDHFVWQRLSRRRVERNPLWTSPYPAKLFLIAGGTSYPVPMRWRRDPLADMKASIEATNAPVTVQIDPAENDVVIEATQPLDFHVLSSSVTDAPLSEPRFAAAVVDLASMPDAQAGARSPELRLALDGAETTLGTPSKAEFVSWLQKGTLTASVISTCFTANWAVVEECGSREDPTAVRFVVMTATDPHVASVRLLRGQGAATVPVSTARPPSRDLAIPLNPTAHTAVNTTARAWIDGIPMKDGTQPLMIVDDTLLTLEVQQGGDGSQGSAFSRLATAIRDLKAALVVSCTGANATVVACEAPEATALQVSAMDPKIREIRLLANPQDPYSNVLTGATYPARAWRLRQEWLQQAKTADLLIAIRGANPAFIPLGQLAGTGAAGAYYVKHLTASFAKLTNTYGLTVREYPGDDLVITARRLGPIELRYQAARADSNILDTRDEYDYPIRNLLAASQWRDRLWPVHAAPADDPTALGILLSWVLLSLGAPFWYDALKNLLKLRPSAAAAEEKNRTDRATEPAPPARK